jgi:hypothetical protein
MNAYSWLISDGEARSEVGVYAATGSYERGPNAPTLFWLGTEQKHHEVTELQRWVEYARRGGVSVQAALFMACKLGSDRACRLRACGAAKSVTWQVDFGESRPCPWHCRCRLIADTAALVHTPPLWLLSGYPTLCRVDWTHVQHVSRCDLRRLRASSQHLVLRKLRLLLL